jgi:hypothetical protein
MLGTVALPLGVPGGESLSDPLTASQMASMWSDMLIAYRSASADFEAGQRHRGDVMAVGTQRGGDLVPRPRTEPEPGNQDNRCGSHLRSLGHRHRAPSGLAAAAGAAARRPSESGQKTPDDEHNDRKGPGDQQPNASASRIEPSSAIRSGAGPLEVTSDWFRSEEKPGEHQRDDAGNAQRRD